MGFWQILFFQILLLIVRFRFSFIIKYLDHTSVLGVREKSQKKEQLNGKQLDLSFFIHPSVQGKKLSMRTYTVIREGTSPENFKKEASTYFPCYNVKLKNVRNFYCNAAIFLFIPVAPHICCLTYITPYPPEIRALTLILFCPYPEMLWLEIKRILINFNYNYKMF